MPEIALCISGKLSKIFSYIDEEKQQFVVMNCKLKKEITEIDLKRFFNQIYNVKLNNSYEKIFEENYTTLDLINCLKDILKEEHVISLKKLYEILNKENTANWIPFMQVMKEFASMFDISKHCYSMIELNEMIRIAGQNPWFNPKDSNFNKELDALLYNTYMMDPDHLIPRSSKKKIKINSNYQRAS